MQKKRSSKQNAQLEQQLAGYAAQAASRLAKVERYQQPRAWVAYAAAAGAALAMAPAVDAAPIHFANQNFMVTVTGPFLESSAVDLNKDGFDDLAFGIFRSTGSSNYVFLSVYDGYVHTAGNYGAKKFASGEVIGSGATASFAALRGTVGGNPYGQWSNSVNAFAGVQFYGYTAGGSSYPVYAWLRIHVQDDTTGLPNKLTLIDWAFDTEPIRTGDTGLTAVPEPSTGSLALLALGAMGLYEWRRRRKQQTPRA